METEKYVEAFYNAFEEEAKPEKALPMKAYMRNQFEFFGLAAPQRKIITKSLLEKLGYPPDLQALKEVVTYAFAIDQREMQYLAMEITEKMYKIWDKSIIQIIELMLTKKPWWDTVDFVASHLVGKYFKIFPEETKPTTEKWRESRHLWLQRTAIIFQLNYKKETDFTLLSEHILYHLHTEEFFIQKAIGWALRQYARIEPQIVKDFVEKYSLPKLSKREALKHLIQKES
ncbi:MAG: DNA alkylation repair protein [Thermonemataceae bacterium]|nr:DNA alkylation repair protein [Thermonemataceae bacterium]